MSGKGLVPGLVIFVIGLAVAPIVLRRQPPQRFAAPVPVRVEASAQTRSDPPENTGLPRYEVTISPSDLNKLERSAHSNETVPATFKVGGVVYENVRIRYRGAWARGWPKKPLKIFFNDDQPFEGQKVLNFNSGWRDPSFLRESLAYEIYSRCGVPASKTRMVRIDFNGRFRGLYVQVEQPGKPFLKRLNLKGASVYKANSHSNLSDERDLGSENTFATHYEKETEKKESSAALQKFCHDLDRTRDVFGFFNENVDVEKYINYLAAGALVQNWDGYNKNHFIVQEPPPSKKWFTVPWDLDRTLGDSWDRSFNEAKLPIFLGTHQHPGITGWNKMQDRFLSEPRFAVKFLARVEALTQTTFTPEKLFPLLDQLQGTIGAEAAEDRQRWPGASPDLDHGIKEVKRYIENRRSYLLREIPQLRREIEAAQKKAG